MTQGGSGAVWLLALGQTLTYAGVYYAFPALLPDLQVATGWSVAELALGPTVAFMVMAALTPFTGRLVDRGYGGGMLMGLPVLGAAGLAGLGLAQTPWQWVALWAMIGVAQAGCLYETCFAFLTRRLGTEARAAITKVTVVAGFAGTLAFPLGDVLGREFGGQGALVAFAAVVLGGAVPVNVLAVRRLRRLDRLKAAPPPEEPGALRVALRRPEFWAIAVVFGLIWLNHGILLTYILMLFADRGSSQGMATLAAACIGPAQVFGRLVLLWNEAKVSNGRATLYALAAVVGGGVLLWAAGVAPLLIFGFAALQGAGAGLLSVLRPMLIAEQLGRRGFGTISGVVAISPILASAAAPSVGAAMLGWGGPHVIYAACLAMAVAGLCVMIWLLGRKPGA